MSFLRRYWIAGLVLVLVSIHAVMIGYVRTEATRLKTVASSEIPLGLFYKPSLDRMWITQLRVHLVVPPAKRLAARATIEHNRWVVHEAVEETLRRVEPDLLEDPALVAVKEAVRLAIEEVLRETGLVDRVVINDRIDLPCHEFRLRPSGDPTRPGDESQMADARTLGTARPVRRTTSEQIADQHADAESHDEHAEHDGHGDGHGDAHGDGHGDSHGSSHGASTSHGSSSSKSHGSSGGHAPSKGHH
jgi:hypothetical protein